MKKFLLNITLFLLPLVICYGLLEMRLAKMPNSYNQKKISIENKLSSIEVLNVGSSHALLGIDPEYLSRPTYNLANVSQTVYYDAKLIELYAGRLPHLKMVIIPIEYMFFYRQMEDLEEDWRMYFYYYYWKIPVRGKTVFDINKYSLTAIYSPYTVMGFIRKRFKVNVIKYSAYGYEWADSAGHLNIINDASGKSRVAYHEQGYSQANVRKGVRDIKECLDFLHKRNIQVVFITTPVYHTYSDHINPSIEENNKIIIDSLCKKYNCSYYNYQNDTRFTIDDYNNDDHLDYLGAAKFSKILDDDIIKKRLN